MPAGHPLHPQREGHRRHGRQPFRHGRDGQGDGDLQHVEEAVASQPARERDDRAQPGDDQQEYAAELCQLLFEGRAPRARFLDQGADLAHLSPDAGGGDDELGAAIRDGRPHVDHVHAITERGIPVRQRVVRLADRKRLPGQCRLLHLQPDVLDDAPICGNPRPCGEDGQVTRHQLRCGDLIFCAVSHDMRDRHGLVTETHQCLLRLPFRQEADGGVQDDDDQDGNGLDMFPEDQRHSAGCHQQPDNEASELVNEDRQRGSTLNIRERIRTVLGVASRHLRCAETARDVRPESPSDVGNRERVPRLRRFA